MGDENRTGAEAQFIRMKSKVANFIEWDVRNWSSALDFWLAHSTQNLSTCRALEIGTRNGGLSLWLALQGARVLATDIEPPTQAALRLHESHGISRYVQYESMDATRIPYKVEFDIVLFKSVLGAIGRLGDKPAQAQAVKEMHNALKPGGELFFAENLVGSPLHQFFRKKFVRWGNTWRYVSVRDMQEFLTPFSKVQYSTLGFAGAFGRTELQHSCLGVLDRTIFQHTIPPTWKYIIVGVAKN